MNQTSPEALAITYIMCDANTIAQMMTLNCLWSTAFIMHVKEGRVPTHPLQQITYKFLATFTKGFVYMSIFLWGQQYTIQV